VLARIEDVQLFTTAHHQGGIDHPEEGLWSWFDVVVLNSPDSKSPKVKDGRELIWLSHEIPTDHDGYTGQHGVMFDRKHDLLNSLEVRYHQYVVTFDFFKLSLAAWQCYWSSRVHAIHWMGKSCPRGASHCTHIEQGSVLPHCACNNNGALIAS
jgi:hypothetical protein